MSSTTTTHKTLRGPRGGMVLTNDEEIAKKINSAIFPGLQGGPLMHVIAAKAVAFHEALQPEFQDYAHAVVANAKALAAPILAGGYKLVTGGTDNHLMLVDLTPEGPHRQGGRGGARARPHHLQQERHPVRPAKADGDVGHPARLAGGDLARLRRGRIRAVGELIVETLDGLASGGESGNAATEARVREGVAELTRRFPIY